MQRTQSRHALLFVIGLGAWLALQLLAGKPAWAHVVAAVGDSWSDGFAHPFSGIDHLAAMVAVGLWAAQIGRGALWLLPAAFPFCMALGAGLGVVGVVVPGAEDGIAVSVAVLGVLLAVAARPPLLPGAALVGAFGFLHGYAHGAAMPAGATPFSYGLGFLAATALLQLVGISLGLAARSSAGQRLLPIGAAAIAGIGVTLMLAL